MSEMAFRDGRVSARHYAARPGQTPDIRLRETMARTFEYWIVAGVEAGRATAVAAAVKERP